MPWITVKRYTEMYDLYKGAVYRAIQNGTLNHKYCSPTRKSIRIWVDAEELWELENDKKKYEKLQKESKSKDKKERNN